MIALPQVSRNALMNVAGQAAPLLVGALTIPATLRTLGPERFGVLALVWVLVGYFSLFDLGLGRATTRFVAASIRRDEQRIPAVVGTAAAAQAFLGGLGAIALWASTPTLVDRVFGLPAHAAAEARDALSILALSIPVLLVTTSFRGTLEATQRFDVVNGIRAPLGMAYFLLPLIGARRGWALSGVVLSILLCQVVGAVVQYVFCIRVFPWARSLRVELPMLRRLLAFGGWIAVSGVIAPVLVYVDRLAIAALVSVAAVGHYAAPHEVVIRWAIVPISLMAVLFPMISAEREVNRRVETLAARSLRALLLIMVPLTVVTVALADDIVRMWLGPHLEDIVSIPLQILAVGALVNSLALVPYSLLQALGRPDITGRLHLVELPFHLALVWLLVNALGLVGAALAWSIRVSIDAVLLFLAAGRFGALRYGFLSSSGVVPLVGGAGALAVTAFGISTLPTLGLRLSATLIALAGAGTLLLDSGRADRFRDVAPASTRST